MSEGRIPQTLLFAGPKGTGKTSTARILGALLNDPINKESVETVFLGKKQVKNPKFQDISSLTPALQNILDGNSFVVNEMDAASNRGIDDIRFLKERVVLPPQEGLISIYILDEAHMLTTEASNALLKILEEPPKHVLFILATTEIHKILPTIISRCQVLNFQKASREELLQALSEVVKAEGLSAEDSVIEVIAQKADGSFRDAIKMTELSVKDKKIALSSLDMSAFSNLDSEIEKLINNIIAKDSSAAILQFENFRSQQLDPVFLHKRILEILHQSLLSSFGINQEQALVSQEISQFLLTNLSEAELSSYNPMPHLPLELRILSIISKAQQKQTDKPVAKKTKTVAESIVLPKKIIDQDEGVFVREEVQLPAATVKKTKPRSESKSTTGLDLATAWSDFVKAVIESSMQAGLLLQSTKFLSAENDQAKIAVYYKFHQQQLQSVEVLAILSEVAETFLGRQYEFCFELVEKNEGVGLNPKLATTALL